MLLQWSETSDFSPVALDKALVEREQAIKAHEEILESLESQEALQYGEFNDNLNFVPLTEEEMAQKSLEVIRNYERTEHAIPHAKVREWIESLGTDNPLPCPN
ncbi:MAG: hypothetical protein F6J89_21305 [Symploca sp. SIO1C4]|uniref:Uncharacterized protein n=1 Tax=Symploca sp. SIO1C4 TaxID=2607765 RepID=A0A6B3N8Z5_9CYAN|nr:hypothetical protein [Symploca sp. SIO1C4]